nr:hypothetical protein [uncultured Mediterranean phage uvMED]
MSILVGATSACAGAAGQGPSADLGDTIDQSLRFRRTQFLKSAAITTSTFTVSVWVKIGRLRNPSVSGGVTSIVIGTAGTSGHGIGFSNNKLYSSKTGIESSEEFRDPSAWYHLVANSTGSIYINNTEILSGGGLQDPSNQEIIIGHIFPNTTQQSIYAFDGQLADFYFIDGSELTPSSFARTNDDGVWVPDTFSGSYGTNGAHLVFDSSLGIGNDSSGQNNDYTATGFDTTAISSSNEDNDIDYNDTPTNNYTTLNPLQNRVLFGSGLTFEQANLRAQYGDLGSNPGGFTQGFKGGKFYWEVTPKVQVELDIGLVSEDYDPTNDNQQFGETANGWAWRNSATSHHNGTAVDPSHTAFGVDDTIGILVDTDAGTAKIEVNGAAQSSSEFTNIPTDKLLFPALRLGGGSGDANAEFNFGQMPFVHTQSGYNDLATNNLPEPTIKNGKEYFDIYTYTSASTAADITFTGWEFQPDLVWFKSTSHGSSHRLYDSVRGVNEAIQSNTTNAEATDTNTFNSFDSNGFSLGTGNSDINYDSRSFVAWGWKAGGTAVSNTDGDITSSVSANTDAGFSIVKYTGNTGDASVGHGLTQAPEVVFTKPLNSSSWVCHFEVLGRNTWLNLNTNDSTSGRNITDYWGTAANWNTTTMGLNTSGTANMNLNGVDTVAYCWHSVEGYSKFGSYTGNGSADGPFVYTGFRPAFLIIKNISGIFSWDMFDSTRSTANPVNALLMPNSSDAEDVASTWNFDFLSNGFKVRTTNSGINGSGNSIVYMAVAENPFGGENAPPATAR